MTYINLTRILFFAILLFLNVIYSNTASAERYTMSQIEQLPLILEKASEKTLVIFDVDEVLVYPTNLVQLQVASPFWEAKMADIEKRLGKTNRDLLHSIMLLQSRWELTDARLPSIIHDLQKRKVQVLALTSFRRGKMGNIESIEEWRNKQLKNYQIDFSISAGLSQNQFEINKLTKSDGTKKPVYRDGIIYTDLHLKSDVLSSFLKQGNVTPKEIIFIDDRLSNINDLEIFCKDFNIGYVGIHDDRILKKYSSFDENLGAYQFQHLEQHHKWLTDEEAKQKITRITPGLLEIADEKK